jgi:hypothetical protein
MANLNDWLSSLPVWLIGIIFIAAGWMAATVVKVIIAKLLKLFNFNRLCDRIGICDFLRKGEVSLSPSELVGHGAYWVILVGVMVEAARLLDIDAAVELRQRAMSMIPALLSAALVLAVGLIFVAFLSVFVRTLSRNAGSPYANLWSRITRWAGTALVLAIAIEQVQIGGSMLAGILYIVIAAIALGMALAFGLGCKDIARNAMEKWIADLKERHRDSSNPDMEG